MVSVYESKAKDDECLRQKFVPYVGPDIIIGVYDSTKSIPSLMSKLNESPAKFEIILLIVL